MLLPPKSLTGPRVSAMYPREVVDSPAHDTNARVANRDDKTAQSCLGIITLASIKLWMLFVHDAKLHQYRMDRHTMLATCAR